MRSFRQLLALAVILPAAFAAASCTAPAAVPAPTPDLQATVAAMVATALPTPTPTATPDLAATIQAAVKATEAARPTATPTATPSPTSTQTPIPSPAPSPTPTNTPPPSPTPTPSPIPLPTATPTPTLADVLKRVLPAVVQIRTDRSWGSGVIIQHISGTGYAEVLTNQHVIADASSIKVIISGGTEYTATLVGSDPTADLALVRFCCNVGLTTLTLGDSVSLPAGTQVIAIGYPLGLSGPPTVTQGIVSAVRYDGEGQRWLVQTDAAINPGNSGGALIKLDGSLIGINTQVVRSSGGVSVEGFGFAVAAQTFTPALVSLRSGKAFAAATATPTVSGSFGPVNGEMKHNPDDGSIDRYVTGIQAAEFMAEAWFFNPYAAGSKSWSYGFIFRQTGANDFQTVILRSDGAYYHIVRTGTVESSKIARQGALPKLNLAAGGKNHLRLLVTGNTAHLFVTGEYVASLDLGGSSAGQPGHIAAIGGYYKDDSVAGATTRFEDFTVSQVKLESGPSSGNLTAKAGFISSQPTGVDLHDTVIEVTFTNPALASTQGWDYGIYFRRYAANAFHTFVVHSSGRWYHYQRNEIFTSDREIANGVATSSTGFSTKPGDKNTLRVIIIEARAYLFINGNLVGATTAPGSPPQGDVAPLAGFFSGSQPAGTVTPFSELRVWGIRSP